jgi:hypothetical protein
LTKSQPRERDCKQTHFLFVVGQFTFIFSLLFFFGKKINLFQVGHDSFLWFLKIINKVKDKHLTSSINKLEHLKLNISFKNILVKLTMVRKL